MSVRYRALDGGLVELDPEAVLGPISCNAVARSRRSRVRALPIVSAGAGYADELALDPNVGAEVRLSHELEVQGGRLRIWSGYQPSDADDPQLELRDGTLRRKPVHLAGWSRGRHDLLMFLYTGVADDLLELLGQFTLGSTADGIVCTPVDSRTAWFVEPASLLVDVPGSGVLEVFERVGKRARRVPRHPGTSVRGGEVFVSETGTEGAGLVHVSTSAVTYLSPSDPVVLQPGLDVLSELTVEWTRDEGR